MWRVDSLEKTLMLGGIGGRRRRGRRRMRWLDGITDSMDIHEFEWVMSWWWTRRPGVLRFMGWQRVRHDWVTEWTDGMLYPRRSLFASNHNSTQSSMVAQMVKHKVGGSDACNVEELASIPGFGRSPGGRHDNPLWYSCLENSQRQRYLAGYSPWVRKESGMIERLSTAQFYSLSKCDISQTLILT